MPAVVYLCIPVDYVSTRKTSMPLFQQSTSRTLVTLWSRENVNIYVFLWFLWESVSILWHRMKGPSLTQRNRDTVLLNYKDNTPNQKSWKYPKRTSLPKSSEADSTRLCLDYFGHPILCPQGCASFSTLPQHPVLGHSAMHSFCCVAPESWGWLFSGSCESF